jgi:hypothetical protein
MELDNLYGNAAYAPQFEILLKELNVQSNIKRLAPTAQPWADGSAVQFGFDPVVPIP